MTVLAIDPGSELSAFVRYDGLIRQHGKVENGAVLETLYATRIGPTPTFDHVAIEMIASYGMSVGKTVFETCVWIGRFLEAWSGPYTLVYRREVKIHLCHTAQSKDANVREALLDRWGGKVAAIGTKKAPGPLHGISSDQWSALAVAVTWWDTKRIGEWGETT